MATTVANNSKGQAVIANTEGLAPFTGKHGSFSYARQETGTGPGRRQHKGIGKKAVALLASLTLAASMAQAIFAAPAVAAEEQVELIGAHSTWSYEDSNTNLFGDAATDFRSAAYDDSAWSQGPAPLGYTTSGTHDGETSNFFGPLSAGGTVMAFQNNPNAYITYYLRNHFNVSDIADITALSAKVAVDDGYVMYLNGHEISRVNMPAGNVGHSTDALATWECNEDRANVTLDLSAFKQYLVVGENVIALDLHNRDGNSSDIYLGMTLTATYAESQPQSDEAKRPSQLNVHVGDDATTQVNVTYTTLAEDATSITLTAAAPDAQPQTVAGESSVGGANKYYHKISVANLAPDTTYNYVAGIAPNTVEGTFKTAPSRDTDDTISFIYLADTQVSNAENAKALGATLAEVNNMNPDFVYLAGDVTDTATSEAQWEWLFNNDGAYPDGGEDMFLNYLIAAAQGNHDNNTFNRHINAPAQEGNIVYSFEYGPVTFIMLNLETARNDATARARQLAFLQQEVTAAKAEGRWVAVGFHKSLYTGASHVSDSDVREARTYWCPVFAQLDVDFVLQGHDHVYSRGFVDESGYNAGVDDGTGTVADPEDAPLYMVGGHAGGLKWYSRVNYTVPTGDPIAPAYSFLDVNSADPDSDPFGNGQGTDVRQEQVIVEVKANKERVDINTYMFKYNTATDTITTSKYLFDSLSITRDGGEAQVAETAALTGPVQVAAESTSELYYTASYANLTGANAFDTAVSYDPTLLELTGIDVLENNAFATADTATPGVVRVVQALDPANAITSTEAVDVVTFAFRLKPGVTAEQAVVALTRADTVRLTDGAYFDAAAALTASSVTTLIYSEAASADVNGDGVITLADLALALSHYRETGAGLPGDVNHDGVVDTADFVLISNYILAG